MNKLLILILLALSSNVYATNNEGGCRGNCGGNDIPPVGDVKQEQGQAQYQDQNQAQAQLQGQGQSQSSENLNLNANTNLNDIDVKNSNTSVNVNDNTSSSNSASYSASASYANGGDAKQGQSQSANNAGNSQNINIEGTGKADHYNQYGNNVSAFSPAIYSSSVCMGGLSAGASAFGMGVSVGGTKKDAECSVRENARILAGLNTNLAIMYLCANPTVDVGAVLGSACKPAEVPEPPVVIEPPVVTPVPPLKAVEEFKDVNG